jgi:hypothetical protein
MGLWTIGVCGCGCNCQPVGRGESGDHGAGTDVVEAHSCAVVSPHSQMCERVRCGLNHDTSCLFARKVFLGHHVTGTAVMVHWRKVATPATCEMRGSTLSSSNHTERGHKLTRDEGSRIAST